MCKIIISLFKKQQKFFLYFRAKHFLNLYRTGFRTSSSKTKQCAPPKAGQPKTLCILWRKRAKQRGRCFATPTPYLLQKHLVRLRCIYSTKSEPIFKTKYHSVPPRAKAPLCSSTELSQRESAGKR